VGLPLGGWALKGNLGVDLFFLLSGLLFGTLHGEGLRGAGAAGWARYALRRLARIYPAYLVALAAWPLLALAAQKAGAPTGFRWDGVSLAAHLAGVQAWARLEAAPWFPVAWSVSAELFCYALLLPALVQSGLGSRRSAGRGMALALLLVALTMAARQLRLESGWFLLDRGVAAEFAAGFLAAGWVAGLGRREGAVLAIAGFLGSLVLALWPAWVDAAILPFLFALVAGLSRLPESWDRVLGWAPLELAGRISYSLYLFHLMVLGLAVILAPQALLSSPPVLSALALYGASLALAWLIHRHVEIPGRKLILGLKKT
jgi:peptidoglycan/LPS O-acetylase OafA/YrhL